MLEVSEVTLYENGVAVYDDGSMCEFNKELYDSDSLFEYLDTNMGGYGYFKVNKTENKFEMYSDIGTAAKTYTTTWDTGYMDIPMQIIVYDTADTYAENGDYYAIVKVDASAIMGGEEPMYVEYTTIKVTITNDGQGNKTISAFDKTYTIESNDSLTLVTE